MSAQTGVEPHEGVPVEEVEGLGTDPESTIGATDDALPSAEPPLGEVPTVDAVTPLAEELTPLLEAFLLMAEAPVPVADLAAAVQAPVEVTRTALAELADFYDRTGRGFQLRDVGGGWSLATRPEHFEALAAWVAQGQTNRLTQAGLETLAVIAYLQPVARSRVGAVRGVNVDSAVRTLLARGLVEEFGTDDQTGASLLVTTDYFLARLGLSSLDELPPLAPLLPDATALEAELAGLANPVDAGDDDA